MKPTRLLLAIAAIAAIGAVPARAAVAASDLLDVSKQVASLQHGFAQYAARHGSVRSGRLSAALADCGERATNHPFSAWGDVANYFLAPEGDFSSSDRWTLNDHATVASDGADNALILQDGGDALSPVLCITADRPTIRFFARNDAGAADSRLEVSVIYQGADGKVKRLKVARLRAGASWQPAIAIPLYVNALAAFARDGTAPVVIQFHATGVKTKRGRWQVDDLYVDPFKGH
jgi:hypothetical protein